MSAKQCGELVFSGTIQFKQLTAGKAAEDPDRERVAILAALSLLTKSELLEKAPPYLLDKLKARLMGFNRRTYQWGNNQQKETKGTKP